MPKLTSRYLLATLLIVPTVLIDCVWMTDFGSWTMGGLIAFAGFGCALGQVAAMTGWLVFGRGPLVVRLAVMLSATGLLTFFIGLSLGGLGEWRGIALVFAAFMAVPAAIVRLMGFGFARRIDDERFPSAKAGTDRSEPGAVSGLKGWQFSLGTLFSWTTSAALLMAVTPWIDFSGLAATWRFAGAILLIYFGGFAAIAGVGFWIVLGGNRPVLRIAVVVLLAIPASFGLVALDRGDAIWHSMCFGLTTYCVAVAIVLRFAGYRFERRRSGGQAIAVEPPDLVASEPEPEDGEPLEQD